MNKYIIIPTSSLYEYDVYFNRKRKRGYKIKKSFFNFVILEKVDSVDGKYVIYDEEHEEIEEVLKTKYIRLGYTENNHINTKSVSFNKDNNKSLIANLIVSIVSSFILVYLIITQSTKSFAIFALLELLLVNMSLLGINNVIDLMKISKKQNLEITRFDIARKTVQSLSFIFTAIFILMVLATSIIPVSEGSVVIQYFIWLGIFVFIAGILIAKLYDNLIQAIGIVVITAFIFFFYQSVLYLQLFLQLIA